MDYQEALASLERGQKQAGMTVKFVPGKTTGGWLSDETRVNLAPVFNASPAQAVEKPSIQDMRDRMMGAPGSKKNIAKHPLQIENLVIDGVATRRYRLAALAGPTLPTVLYFHGGAYYGGSVAGAEMLCRALANFAGCQVISVDYPLAPEHPFPAAPLACYRVLNYLHEHADWYQTTPAGFVLAGDSAGGGLVLTTAYLDQVVFATNWVEKLVLKYPDVPGAQIEDTSAGIEFKEFGEQMRAFFKSFSSDTLAWGSYFGTVGSLEHPLIAVINAPGIERLPKTLVISGEVDPLRLSNEKLVDRLRQTGVAVTHLRYNGVTHGFVDQVGYAPQAEDALKEAAKFIKE
ncbi:alpha/beta hydrolase [Limosilactobacillus fermentum]|uniref:alpha/beta hydrolase n=1 Tax=Limosilactobacillus fermentum TaxID=1613 RepID=UPI00245550D2|nr:alpha/beta hydrolase [Limosilactobacillus fermentum]MDH5017109.1 alpha/beta hydrolase [Limosilactobacillus fermentum]